MTAWTRSMRRTAVVALAFSVLTLFALGWNAVASRAADPNPPTRIDELVTRLNLDPTNKDLLARLRKEDEWVRASYFRSNRFAQIGFLLLLGGVTTFLVSAKGAKRIGDAPALPDPTAPARLDAESWHAQTGVLAMALGLGGVLALVATLARHDTVSAYVAAAPLPQITPKATAPEGLGTALATPSSPASPGIAPAATSAVTTPPAGGPVALGGTALTPLPVSPGAIAPVTAPPKGKVPSGTAVAIKATDWPLFRGPGGSAFADLPKDWDVSAGKGLLWKADLPLPGWNSPIIFGRRIFLAGADPKQRELEAFQLSDGKLLWRLPIAPLPGSTAGQPSPDAGFAPATMATDGERVFAAFVNGDVVCATVDGKPLWGRAFGPLANTYGFASSLLFVGGNLIVQVDQGSPEDGKSRLYALNPKTGKSVWEAKRPVSASWASPIAITIGGHAAVVAAASPWVAAYDAGTGAEIWHAEGMSGELAPSPVFGDGQIFAGQSGSVMLGLDAATGRIVWNSSDASLPDISSPAYGKGLVFLCGVDGTASAIDAKSGKVVWEKRLPKPCKASPIVVGDSVFFLGSDGVMKVVAATRTFRLLSEHRIGEATQATPAFAQGRMIIRGEHHLFCLGTK